MSEYLNKRTMKTNAARIVALADAFGHLDFNDHGQTIEATLNLSIPCARLIKAEIVDRVFDTNDGVNDNAVNDVERLCRQAIDRLSNAWEWEAVAQQLKLPDANYFALEDARNLGIRLDVTYDKVWLAATITEIVRLPWAERKAAVAAINDGAQVKDRAAYAEVSAS